MRVLLVYYTGTYNTRYLTDRLARELTERGHSVERTEIDAFAPIADTSDCDVIGFGYPIYGFNSPLPFNRYVDKLDIRAGQKFFIYKNSGETFAMNNASSRILLRRMRRKKAVFAGEYHFVMPYNIHFAFDTDFVREILEKDGKLLKILAHDLESGCAPEIKSNAAYNIASAAISIQKVGGAVNSFFYRADDRCVKCGQCAKNCPEGNIKIIEGRVKFGHRCDMCMRCSFFCPTDAIHIGFLQNWKVNGDYRLAMLEAMGAPEKPYITAESRGFYSCFKKHFDEIDRRYAELFGKN